MHRFDQQLAALGLGGSSTEPACWAVRRIAATPFGRCAPVDDPGRRTALLRWRDLLGREESPSPYRIRRIG